MTLLFSPLLLAGDNGAYVLLQESNYEHVKIYCDSALLHISQKPFSRTEACGLPEAKSFQRWNLTDNEI